ncbi:Nucleic acid-binding OB-fold [Penicillium atrosanguineum]|uniref:DNA replication licensing factor MCM2 n=1 Tax=Penicillium atrosanguineum TaxID=1132637 RepID=A0A9W9KU96_9EURO|nr:facilitated glucose transporter [Penicillium atrosanguineum]KAJ5119164.1 Nucleic acid-binding OB-fold [Penicillium atrosanguineum]KAJ5120202.1 Nucleic acid-binding OB-fold [Penicillium atrosanguineum]KAJ5297199.1 facilitated glucose transporter [Penicillium atrosanguineum]KAJ5299960.1 Nucleic acid-binding OB-fold [Penicillium atrosanguineum]
MDPLRPSDSAANRGPRGNTRKREREEDMSSPAPLPPSSPMALASSPPALPFDDDEDDDEEAELVPDIDDVDELAEDEDGIDLFGDNFERDYHDAAQDQYQNEAYIDDDGDHDELDAASRRQLDSRLNKRDRELQRRRRMPAAFLQDDDDVEMDLSRQPRRRRHHYDEDREDIDMADEGMEELSLEELADVKAANITDWVTQPQVLRSIYREFKAFLTEFIDPSGQSVYGNRIKTLGEVNSASLEVSYAHLSETKAALSYFLANEPTEVLKVFDQVALDVTLFHYPQYHDIHNEIHVRITDVPIIYTLRQLRQSHLNCLVRVSGVVTRRSGVFPQLKYVMFLCQKCGITLGPFQQEASQEVKISFCQNCQSRGPFTVNSEKTVYRNYQKLTLQESPGSVPAGRLPRQREVVLLADLIDLAKPGDEIEITGIYRNSYDAQLNNKNGFPVFATIIEANHVVKSHDQLAGFNLTEEDEREIRALSREPDIVDRIVRSMAPSIYGHYDVKTAVALSLFGGVSKQAQGKMSIRGDINVLLLGDPGTAKSQILKYVEKTAHRAVFATGQGASAVGLTASVRRDPLTSEWTLEGGALVLADRGTCLIDEFDKMNDQDRTSIHEAMEQQTISISKAGIVTTLQARCAVVAAANPTGGRYNSTKPFSENVELTEPILSRFDILCVVRDLVEPTEDERLANFVIESHHRANPLRPLRNENGDMVDNDGQLIDADGYRIDKEGRRMPPSQEEIARRAAEQKQAEEEKEGEIPQELLRKYILYAREHCHPKLYQIDQDKVARLFADMRRESLATGAYPITVRHLEAIMRIAESFCKMRLSEYCSAQDIDRAIAVTVESFIGSQKVSAKKALSRAFAKYTLSRPKPQSKRRAGVAQPNLRVPRNVSAVR